MQNLEKYFDAFRQNIVGIDQEFDSPYGRKKILYADWIASGRLYEPIERKLLRDFGPYVANTHTETNTTGTLMTKSYQHAHRIIKDHVNASSGDVIITAGFGMTSVVNKLQRILSLKGCGSRYRNDCPKMKNRPVVFVTHMEHHSNHTSWYETIADVVQLRPDPNLLVDPGELRPSSNSTGTGNSRSVRSPPVPMSRASGRPIISSLPSCTNTAVCVSSILPLQPLMRTST